MGITYHRAAVLQACLDKIKVIQERLNDDVIPVLKLRESIDRQLVKSYILKHTRRRWFFFGELISPTEEQARQVLPNWPEDKIEDVVIGSYYSVRRHNDLKNKIEYLSRVKMEVELLFDKVRFSTFVNFEVELTEQEFKLIRKYFPNQ